MVEMHHPGMYYHNVCTTVSENVADIWTSKLWVSLAPSNSSEATVDCMTLRMLVFSDDRKKRVYIQPYFVFILGTLCL